MDDIFRRKVWSLSTGKVFDDSKTDNVSDDKLRRDIGKADDIRVELTLKNALKLFERKGPDGVEIFLQPRLRQEIAGRSFGGITLRPGFSLDLTMDDPATGQPWDSSKPAVQSRVIKLAGCEAILPRGIPTLHCVLTVAGDQQSKARPKGYGDGAQGWK